MALHSRMDSVELPVAMMGTISVQLPQATTADFNTIVTVAGMHTDYALAVFPNKHNSAAYGFENSTAYILSAAEPGEGQVILYFTNLGQATGYVDRWYTYIATKG